MIEIIRLDPHDPLPEASPCALVIRRFGEDDPRAVITEIDFFGRNPSVSIAAGPNGKHLPWEEAVQYAAREAEMRGYTTLYAVDRTAGRREQEVLSHDGDHTVRVDELSDTDMEDGERGNTILDRPHDAGYLR